MRRSQADQIAVEIAREWGERFSRCAVVPVTTPGTTGWAVWA
jgi:hypothetical protein